MPNVRCVPPLLSPPSPPPTTSLPLTTPRPPHSNLHPSANVENTRFRVLEKKPGSRMNQRDGPMDGPMDGYMDRPTEGRTDGQEDRSHIEMRGRI